MALETESSPGPSDCQLTVVLRVLIALFSCWSRPTMPHLHMLARMGPGLQPWHWRSRRDTHAAETLFRTYSCRGAQGVHRHLGRQRI